MSSSLYVWKSRGVDRAGPQGGGGGDGDGSDQVGGGGGPAAGGLGWRRGLQKLLV